MNESEAKETIAALKREATRYKGADQVSWRECTECLVNCRALANGKFKFRVIRNRSPEGVPITEVRALQILKQYRNWRGG